MATPAQDFRKMFEATTASDPTPAQSFRALLAEEQAKDASALYISPRLRTQ